MPQVSSGVIRTLLISVMLILPALGAVNAVYHGRMIQRYVRQTDKISDLAGLARFQELVSRQMYAALFQLGLILASFVVYLAGIPTEILRFADIVYVMIPGLILVVLGFHFKKVEAEACRIPAVGEDLEKQRLAVIKTWRTRPLPDW